MVVVVVALGGIVMVVTMGGIMMVVVVVVPVPVMATTFAAVTTLEVEEPRFCRGRTPVWLCCGDDSDAPPIPPPDPLCSDNVVLLLLPGLKCPARGDLS
jgi:hypothetical protein